MRLRRTLAVLLTAVLVWLPTAARPPVAATAAQSPATTIAGLPTYLPADMVTLDRAYIAALALTSQERREPSLRAMAVLVPTWKAFQAKYAAANPADPQWRPDFDLVDGMIGRADGLVLTGASLVEAHDELEGVRVTLMHLRSRNGIAYYVDGLTAFHEPMEAIMLAAKGKTPETLTAADRDLIKERLPEALALWSEVAAAPFDAGLYGFGEAKQGVLRRQVAAEADALAQLQAAVDSGDTGAVIQRAPALKGVFAPLFMLFGDFELLG